MKENEESKKSENLVKKDKFKNLLIDTGVLSKDLAKHLSFFQTMLSNKLKEDLDAKEKHKISEEIKYLSFLKFELLEEYNFGAFERYWKTLDNVGYGEILPILSNYDISLCDYHPMFENVDPEEISIFRNSAKEDILRWVAYQKYLKHDKEVSKRRCELFKLQYQLFLDSEKSEIGLFDIDKEYIDLYIEDFKEV